MCHFARLRMPGYEETRWREVRHELSGADRVESIYQIVECSFNVLRRRWRSPTCPFSSRCWLVAAGGDDVLRTGCIQNNWSILFIFLSFVILGHREHHRISHFAPFAFLFLDHESSFSCLVILYRKQACWTHLTWFVWVRIGRFCIEDFDLVAIWCICKCSLFVYCKGCRSIVWQCLSYLIYIDKQP